LKDLQNFLDLVFLGRLLLNLENIKNLQMSLLNFLKFQSQQKKKLALIIANIMIIIIPLSEGKKIY